MGRIAKYKDPILQAEILELRGTDKKPRHTIPEMVKATDSSIHIVRSALEHMGMVKHRVDESGVPTASQYPSKTKQCTTCPNEFEAHNGDQQDCDDCIRYHADEKAKEKAAKREAKKKKHKCKCGKRYGSPIDAHGRKIYHICGTCWKRNNAASGGMG